VALQPGPVTARIHAKNTDLAAVTSPVTLENLNRRGLARPVRAQQREHLANPDLKIDTPDSLHAGVGLHQAANLHRERTRRADLNQTRMIKFAHVLIVSLLGAVQDFTATGRTSIVEGSGRRLREDGVQSVDCGRSRTSRSIGKKRRVHRQKRGETADGCKWSPRR
jgi:hypothetical protein